MTIPVSEYRKMKEKQGFINHAEYDVLIGIDPGVNTGVAVKHKAGNLLLKTTTFWGAIEGICKTKEVCDKSLSESKLLVVIEDPNLNRPTFAKKGVSAVEIKKFGKVSQNVGMNKMMAKLLIEYCELNKIPVQTVRPKTAKWTAEALKAYTGYVGKSSQHARDAAKLIF